MTFKELQAEKIKAMKEKDSLKNKTLTAVIASVKNKAIANKCKDSIPEEIVNEILLKELRLVKEMLITCPASRVELFKEYTERHRILKEYAPVINSNVNDIKNLIINIGIPLEKRNRGKIMKVISTQYKHQFDMAVVNSVLTSLLQ